MAKETQSQELLDSIMNGATAHVMVMEAKAIVEDPSAPLDPLAYLNSFSYSQLEGFCHHKGRASKTVRVLVQDGYLLKNGDRYSIPKEVYLERRRKALTRTALDGPTVNLRAPKEIPVGGFLWSSSYISSYNAWQIVALKEKYPELIVAEGTGLDKQTYIGVDLISKEAAYGGVLSGDTYRVLMDYRPEFAAAFDRAKYGTSLPSVTLNGCTEEELEAAIETLKTQHALFKFLDIHGFLREGKTCRQQLDEAVKDYLMSCNQREIALVVMGMEDPPKPLVEYFNKMDTEKEVA